MPDAESLFAHHGGVAFTLTEAVSAGVGRGRLRHPEFGHPHHGVYSHDLDDYALLDRCRAIAPVLQPDQALSHGTAARLLGVPTPRGYRFDEELHVLTRAGMAPMRREGIVGWETVEDVAFRRMDDLTVVAPAAVWSQLSVRGALGGRSLLTPEWLVAVGDFLITGARKDDGREQALCSLLDLEIEARQRRGQRGAKALAWALPRIRYGSDSPKETELRLGLVARGLPEPDVQVPVATAEGLRHADLGYPDARLLLEYLGDEHRASRERWLEDLHRVQLFQDAGYQVVMIGAADLGDGLPRLADRVRRALRART